MAPLPDLGMAPTARQECFGDAFLVAVAGFAGCAISSRRPDDDSIDWTLSCRLSNRPKLDIQMKTIIADNGDDEVIKYALRRKNYDDLIVADVLTPRILVLVMLPRDAEEWMSLSVEMLVLRKCAYWTSLAGFPATENSTSVTVSVPRVNMFSAESLCKMMQNINETSVL